MSDPWGDDGAIGKVMLVEDEEGPRRALERVVRTGGFAVRAFENGRASLNALAAAEGQVDAVVTDLYMPELGGLELLQEVRQRWPDLGVIVMTGAAEVSLAVEAMRRGAYDYLVKPVDPLDVLLPCIRRAVEHTQLVRRNRYLERRLDVTERFDEMIGSSDSMRRLFSLIDGIAPTDATVLILGESGTGKELVARAIHRRGTRARKPFVALNCGALAENVLESELFGHVRGAFTGAVSSRRGLFEEASGGTLFLDEVGELPPSMQVRLLRVLQEGEVRPVGSNETRTVDVRIIAATNRDLGADVRTGRFREDLYYRLNVVMVPVPALRSRRDDIPRLVEHMIRKRSALRQRHVESVNAEALRRLCDYSWPGNVRELENVIERAVVFAREGKITLDDLPPEVAAGPAPAEEEPEETSLPLSEARALFEQRYVRRVLSRSAGNIAEAARLSGLDRSNFRRLMKRHGV